MTIHHGTFSWCVPSLLHILWMHLFCVNKAEYLQAFYLLLLSVFPRLTVRQYHNCPSGSVTRGTMGEIDQKRPANMKCVRDTWETLKFLVINMLCYVFICPYVWLFHMLMHFVRNDELKMNNHHDTFKTILQWVLSRNGTRLSTPSQFNFHSGPLLSTWINLKHGYLITCSVKGGIILLIHFHTPTAAPLKFWNGSVFSPTLYVGCNYLSKLRLQFNHVSKRGPGFANLYKWNF